jgi:hypothetical protein
MLLRGKVQSSNHQASDQLLIKSQGTEQVLKEGGKLSNQSKNKRNIKKLGNLEI